MRFNRIFTKDIDCKLWSVCYPEHGKKKDIFSILFKNWNDPEYLYQFFKLHNQLLLEPPYYGMEIEDAIDQVEYEALEFERLIYGVQKKKDMYKDKTLDEIFSPLHSPEYLIYQNNINEKKGKPILSQPMLRLYAVKLEDSLIVTGGGIKLVGEMRGSYLQTELDNLKKVHQYLKTQGIVGVEGFDEDYN